VFILIPKHCISNQRVKNVTKNLIFLIVKIKIDCRFAAASPTQLAPFESPRVGTQQGY